MNIDDRPTDLTFWKISNGHNSATVHAIHFLYALASPAMGHWGTCPPSTSNCLILFWSLQSRKTDIALYNGCLYLCRCLLHEFPQYFCVSPTHP